MAAQDKVNENIADLKRQGIEVFECNLLEYPTQRIGNQLNNYVLGDLHGNALRLFHTLIILGCIESTDEQYARFQELYGDRAKSLHGKKDYHNAPGEDPLTEDEAIIELQVTYAEMVGLIGAFTVPPAFNKNKLIIFIGDCICDRGNSDFMTLLLFKFLHDNQIKFMILFSNHDSAALYQYVEYGFTRENDNGLTHIRNAMEYASYDGHRVLQNGLFAKIYSQIYLPRLLHLVAVVKPTYEIYYISHAPINNNIFAKHRAIGIYIPVSKINDELCRNIANRAEGLEYFRSFSLNNYSEDTTMGMAEPPDPAPIEAYVGNSTAIWNYGRSEDSCFVNVIGHVGEVKVQGPDRQDKTHILLNAGRYINLDTNLGKREEYNNGLLAIYGFNGRLHTRNSLPNADLRETAFRRGGLRLHIVYVEHLLYIILKKATEGYMATNTAQNDKHVSIHKHGGRGRQRGQELMRLADGGPRGADGELQVYIYNEDTGHEIRYSYNDYAVLIQDFCNGRIDRLLGFSRLTSMGCNPHSWIAFFLQSLRLYASQICPTLFDGIRVDNPNGFHANNLNVNGSRKKVFNRIKNGTFARQVIQTKAALRQL